MFGVKFIKFQPTEYVIQYSKGKIKRKGSSLSFCFFSPTTSLVVIPIGSKDVPFMFEELTLDFQTVSVQGNLSYRIVDMDKISQLLNYTYHPRTKQYLSDDPMKLSQRVINVTSVLVKKHIEKMELKQSIQLTEELANQVLGDLEENKEIKNFGLEILGFSILAVTPNKETSRALEAQTREEFLKRADEALYERRNAAILQERKIKENELNTEITIVDKKREITEAELACELSSQQAKNKINQEQLDFEIKQEETKIALVHLEVENSKAKSDARAYELNQVMESLKGADQNTLKALISVGKNSSELIALAFQDIANNASKIGELNISPELLNQLVKK
ncbi:MAG: membrane protease subunit, stomatin/prohibitin [Tenericutes bacterium GWF2_57_13]|nr:MAG: membrane protease subunit, stomatin/prohibitin [Tenericutes bacterium GWF2_57_13]